MATNLRHLLPSIRSSVHPIRSSAAASASGFRLFNSGQEQQLEDSKRDQEDAPPPISTPEDAGRVEGSGEEEEAEEEEEVDGAYVNKQTREVSGPREPEPTRYGDWEKGGRCSDF